MDVAKTRINAAGDNPKKMIIGVGMVLCLIIVVVSLYPALREYYIAYRINEQLIQELAAIEERNDQIREQIAYLNTEEGIADRARERFGWVAEGEQAVNITGLDVLDSTTMLPAQIMSGSVPALDTWWTDFCDVLFAIQEAPEPEPIPDPFIKE